MNDYIPLTTFLSYVTIVKCKTSLNIVKKRARK